MIIIVQKIAEIAHAHGALVLVDNSIMSPVLSQPLDLGAGNMLCFDHSEEYHVDNKMKHAINLSLSINFQIL